jgi:hypothetical protein
MTYRLYRLDGRRQIVGAPDYFEAVDDATALAEAERLPHRHPMEVWAAERFVGLVAPAVAARTAR